MFIATVCTFVAIEQVVSVCLKGNVHKGRLYLNCKVDSLRANVEIYGPDTSLYGSCFGPTRFSPRYVVCDKKRNITQNLDTNITTIVKADGANYSIYGLWTCKHGTGLGSDTFYVAQQIFKDETTCSVTSSFFIVNILWSTFLLGTTCFLFFRKRLKRKWRDFRTNKNALGDAEKHDDTTPLLGRSSSGKECCRCNMLTTCAFCVTCRDFYCEVCCDAHTKSSPAHSVCLIDHVVKTSFDVKCNYCKTKDKISVCVHCKEVCCSKCICCGQREHSERVNVVALEQTRHVRNPSECSSALELKYKIDLPINDSKLNRVCGLCFLNDETVVVADINNQKLKVISKNKTFTQSIELQFPDEPRGMTHMFDNQFAVTFAYNQEIKIFDLSESTIRTVRTISLNKIGKPYSIAYNADHFAVEIGESEAGFIAILGSNGKVVHSIYSKHDEFAYFTGNTIRFALDMNNGKLFVAGLSKNIVSCINFTGHTLWKVPISSPRGIVFLPGIQLEDKNLILASKRHDTVYQMSSRNGNTEVLISEGIEGPRYMAYNHHTKLLCIQMGNNKLVVYKYDIK